MEVKENVEAEFPYNYIEQDGKEYKVPISVFASIQEMIKDNPEIKKFKIKKSGEGKKTKYTTIPIMDSIKEVDPKEVIRTIEED